VLIGIGTRAYAMRSRGAFDMGSIPRDPALDTVPAVTKLLSARRTASIDTFSARWKRDVHFRVHEDTDLRNRAETYDVPILGNLLSFRVAHEAMSAMDHVQL
jgi:hypothetical protein